MSEDRQASPANRAEETVQAGAFGDDGVLYIVQIRTSERRECVDNFDMSHEMPRASVRQIAV